MAYELWAWVVDDVDGEGIVAAVIPGMGASPVPLHSRRRDVAEKMRPIATAHGLATGRPVRLVHLTEAVPT